MTGIEWNNAWEVKFIIQRKGNAQYKQLSNTTNCHELWLKSMVPCKKTAKSNAPTALNKIYSSCFLETLPQSWNPEIVIIDGMFIIQSEPLGMHRCFNDYAAFLLNRWIKSYFNKGIKEVPILYLIKKYRSDYSFSSYHHYATIHYTWQHVHTHAKIGT